MAEKRGGDRLRVTLDTQARSVEVDSDQRLDLDEALKDARKARLVELRHFGGLELEACAKVLGLSPATADRDGAFSRAWLAARLAHEAKARATKSIGRGNREGGGPRAEG